MMHTNRLPQGAFAPLHDSYKQIILNKTVCLAYQGSMSP